MISFIGSLFGDDYSYLFVVTTTFVMQYPGESNEKRYHASPSSFGGDLEDEPLVGKGVLPIPADACSEVTLQTSPDAAEEQLIAVIERGECDFYQKVLNAQRAGAAGVVVYDNTVGSLITMSSFGAEEAQEIVIPSVFVSKTNGVLLSTAIRTKEVHHQLLEQL